jgi:hypothetical protein
MAGILIKILIGLFFYLALPSLICKKRKYKKNTWQHFVNISCKIIGVAVMVCAGFDLIKMLLNNRLS